jgi:hypothetical protein
MYLQLKKQFHLHIEMHAHWTKKESYLAAMDFLLSVLLSNQLQRNFNYVS